MSRLSKYIEDTLDGEPLMFRLYLLFIFSLFLSGTDIFVIPAAGQHINISPANIIIGIGLITSIFTSYRSIRDKNTQRSSIASVGTSLVSGLRPPKNVVYLLWLVVILWAFMLVALVKDNPFVGTQSILTGIAGVGALWFTLRSITRLSQLRTVATIFVALTTLFSVLTLLVSSDVLPIRSLSMVSVPTTPVPGEFESFLPIFDRDIVFGFSSDTLGANILISISILIIVLATVPLSVRGKLLSVAALLVLVLTAFTMQSRGLWIAAPIFAGLLFTLMLTHGRVTGVRPIAVLVFTTMVVIAFAAVISLVGGPRENGEELSRFYNHQRPTVLGREVPREFVFNGAIRLNYFREAGRVLSETPFTGAHAADLGNQNSHSSYADIVMIAGAAPLLILITMIGYIYKTIGIDERLPYPWFEISISLIIALLLTNLFYFGIFQKQFLVTLGVITLLPHLLAVNAAQSPIARKTPDKQ